MLLGKMGLKQDTRAKQIRNPDIILFSIAFQLLQKPVILKNHIFHIVLRGYVFFSDISDSNIKHSLNNIFFSVPIWIQNYQHLLADDLPPLLLKLKLRSFDLSSLDFLPFYLNIFESPPIHSLSNSSQNMKCPSYILIPSLLSLLILCTTTFSSISIHQPFVSSLSLILCFNLFVTKLLNLKIFHSTSPRKKFHLSLVSFQLLSPLLILQLLNISKEQSIITASALLTPTYSSTAGFYFC